MGVEKDAGTLVYLFIYLAQIIAMETGRSALARGRTGNPRQRGPGKARLA